MLTTSKITTFALTAAVCSMLTIPAASAATISQTINSGSTVSWNDALWGGSTPTAGNDYVSTVGTGAATTIYTVNGIVWSQLSWTVQDTDFNTVAAASASSTFAGDSLRVSTQAPINGKATGGSTQTANIVFNGGFYRGNYLNNGAATAGSTLDGTISFATGSTIAAIGMLSPLNAQIYTFNVDSTITGGAGNLLQLTMNGGTGRESHFNVNSDLSGFYGTIYCGVSTAGAVTPGVKAGSFFSINSDALNATIQLDYTSSANFGYNLQTDVTVGSLLLGNGAGTLLGPGIYDAAGLNTLTGTSAYFGPGTITVVPEPSATAFAAFGALGLVWATRFRRRAA